MSLNPSIADIPMPPGVAALPVAANGYPVPWFVTWIDGRPEFRVASAAKKRQAVWGGLCWVCGQSLGSPPAPRAFVIGPMCSVNRVSAEPPSHPACAEYSVRACPFLTRPHARRRPVEGLPTTLAESTPGVAIERNPGCAAVWHVSRRLTPVPGEDGLFDIGYPIRVDWWAEGRTATRAEVLASVEGGLPELRKLCDTPADHERLDRLLKLAAEFFPAA